MNPMEPVQPTPSVDAQPSAAPQPDTQASTGGRFSRVTGFAKGALGLSEQPAASAPSFEAATTVPGLQPKVDTTPASAIPSPWANPDVAAAAAPTAGIAPALPEDPFAPKPATEPTAKVIPDVAPPSLSSIAEPTFGTSTSSVAEPTRVAPVLPEDPFAPKPTTELTPTTGLAIAEQTTGVIHEPQGPTATHDMLSNPAKYINPEPVVTTDDPATDAAVAPGGTTPAPAVSPVWTPDTTLSNTAAEPTAQDATHISSETHEEPPLFRKGVDGDLIRYEFTPEGREKIKGAFTKAIEEGLLDNVLGPLMDRPESLNKDSLASVATEPTLSPTSMPTTETQTSTPQAELPPPSSAPVSSPTLPGTI